MAWIAFSDLMELKSKKGKLTNRFDQQKPFEKMIIMRYDCVGIGVVKMTVGVRRRTHEKVQYCITALEI